MSWSVIFRMGPDEVASPTISDSRADALSQNRECGDQFAAGVNAASAIVRSGCAGIGKSFHVVLSGHANPRHEPREGYAKDCINISLSQL